ncbi:MAG: hypothetical protein VYD19_09365 [Myxococcota bacterium]|nr:hypothetical protein [Myxococcota bacterium]
MFSRSHERGLALLPTDELIKLLKLSHRGELPAPLSRSDLLLRGMNRAAEEGALLFGLDRRALNAILIAVIAERRAQSRR